MGVLTILLAFIYGSLLLVIFPFIFVRLNSIFLLPVFSFFIFKILGLVLILIAGIIWLYSISLFHFLGKGTPVPINPPKKLVIKGIYKYTRNPMYLSVLIMLTGYFLFFGHVSLLLYLLSMALFLNFFVIYYEEPTLRKKFGKSYVKYCKNVRRWL